MEPTNRARCIAIMVLEDAYNEIQEEAEEIEQPLHVCAWLSLGVSLIGIVFGISAYVYGLEGEFSLFSIKQPYSSMGIIFRIITLLCGLASIVLMMVSEQYGRKARFRRWLILLAATCIAWEIAIWVFALVLIAFIVIQILGSL